MLTGAALQSLVLAAVCLSSWAVPLRNITSSEEDRRTESNTPSLEPPEVSSERSLSSFSSRVHEALGGVTAVDGEDRTLRWDSSYHTRTADGQQTKALPEESLSAAADLSPTEPSPSPDRPSETTDHIQPESTPEPEEETSLNISGGSAVRLLTSRAVEVTDVWTEALHLQTEAVNVEPSSQDLLTDATMSSEDLPLIFEPFEDVTPARNSALASRLSVAVAPTAVTAEDAELMVSMDTEHTSSLSGLLDWPSSWQTSQTQNKTTEHDGKTENDDLAQRMTATSSDVVPIPKTDTEDVESKEEADEDEEDDGMDSDEEESEEDLTETSMTPPSRPPYSLIPPPPVWMQGNHGLVRSWVELIREKAGYVSGMLAPVGIGLAGALLLVGALYSIRLIHRRRRENVKHQRSRPPREVRSGPDNAMLLADSSEDEF
ncbi:armadillo-like helical domain-containing protein 4 isoform X2 [Triplophysa rosa]|uniref:Armadillo-like helical domain-containing protein 4 n=1 Tax=Triplophysa rosa TaxID=992332 RepID=A0A9W7TIR3_TRIRA|nr:armadillo-like helical domain-containing protein 4 isoform X2 [Triplophysa rosa]KAI7799543.1 hypothetical protein IRJ41_005504 [Triplophysa rosa]